MLKACALPSFSITISPSKEIEVTTSFWRDILELRAKRNGAGKAGTMSKSRSPSLPEIEQEMVMQQKPPPTRQEDPKQDKQ